MTNDIEEFRRAAHEAVDWIADFLADPRKYPVLPAVKPGELIDQLPAAAPDEPETFDAILRDFHGLVLPAVTHWNHPRFMAYFATSATGPGILGEMLAAALNTNGLHWKTSPAVAELEQVTLGWLRQWMGLSPNWFGIIFDTASTSSLHALAAAREYVDPESRQLGASRNLTVYTSEQSHNSIDKAAIALGIGQQNIRHIATDSEFRMRPDKLAEAVERDVADGRKPCCIVATAGTTVTTSVDPVAEIAAIAGKHNCWLHVDSAYAGSAAILPEFRWILEGVEQAHSLVVNPHKWLFTPVDLSAFYTSRPDILRRAFSLVPEYLRPAGDPRAVNYMEYGIPLGRRFRSLKLWFILRYYGRRRIEEMLREHIRITRKLHDAIAADERFEIVAPTLLSVVCFRLKGADDRNARLLEAMNASGQVFLSNTVLNGRYTLRLAIGNAGTTEADVDAVWRVASELADRV